MERITKKIKIIIITFFIIFIKNILIIPNASCKFYPSCSNYSKEAFEKYNIFYALLLTIRRLLKCNPFSFGGFDPVPEKKGKKL
jgi:putative membrane protein insertion efficiency factor